MTNRVLKAYIKDKYNLKVKGIKLGFYGYYVLQEVQVDTFNTEWELYNNKIYNSISEIIDDLNKNDKCEELNIIEKDLEDK